ncbi:hypothetical protein L0337_11935 [candidate division KSB1 bacterium]|nr:hypothetical protein [candidate division KSB1 bacterium]
MKFFIFGIKKAEENLFFGFFFSDILYRCWCQANTSLHGLSNFIMATLFGLEADPLESGGAVPEKLRNPRTLPSHLFQSIPENSMLCFEKATPCLWHR